MKVLPLVVLVLTALVHVLPASVLFREKAVGQLYGDVPLTPEISLLLRHRAAGFATLAAMAVAALFVEAWRTPVLVFALSSVAFYVLLWLRSGVRTPVLDRVAYVDLALVPCLIAAMVLG